MLPAMVQSSYSISNTSRRSRLPVLAVIACGLALGGCASTGGNPFSMAEAPPPPAQDDSAQPKTELQKAAAYWEEQYKKNPNDTQAALNYARNLKALGAKQQAFAVLQAAHNVDPVNKTIKSELGRLALQQDQIVAADKLLAQADDPVHADWKTVSARGTVLAKQGKYREAMVFFERARAMAPQEGTVLNNLALAYAMDGQADKAETMLRQALAEAPSDERIQRNLSLALSLQGKHDQAHKVMASAMPDDRAADDSAYLRQMVKSEPQTAQPRNVASAPTANSAAVRGQAPVSTSSTRRAPAPGKSMAVPTEDASLAVQRLANQADMPASNQPVNLVGTR